MKIPSTSKAEDLCQQYTQAYSARDLDAVMRLFTDTSQMWGTGLDEYRKGLDAISEQHKRDWSQSDRSSIRVLRFHNPTAHNTWTAADFEVDLTIKGENYHFEDLRGTVIVDQINGEWKIMHCHASFPDYRNPEGNSFPIPI